MTHKYQESISYLEELSERIIKNSKVKVSPQYMSGFNRAISALKELGQNK